MDAEPPAGHGRILDEQPSTHLMKFVVHETAFDHAETVEVDARDVGEALRQAYENTNVSVKIREVDHPMWGARRGLQVDPLIRICDPCRAVASRP
jgi:hypothetical protein